MQQQAALKCQQMQWKTAIAFLIVLSINGANDKSQLLTPSRHLKQASQHKNKSNMIRWHFHTTQECLPPFGAQTTLPSLATGRRSPC